MLLSLVRTRAVGHLRDVRRLVVALSRARLGLYVFCRQSLFQNCYELSPAFNLLLRRPSRLRLVLNEAYPGGQRPGTGDAGPALGLPLYEVCLAFCCRNIGGPMQLMNIWWSSSVGIASIRVVS